MSKKTGKAKPAASKPEKKSLKVRGIVAVARNGDYIMLAQHEAKTDAQIHALLASQYWKIEQGEFVAIFETTIEVTFPPVMTVKIPPLVLNLSENKNE